MNEKRCSGLCKLVKPITDFHFLSKQKGTRVSECKECRSAYSRKHYLANKKSYKESAMKRLNLIRSENRPKLLSYLKDHPCVDCSESNPVVLEFDHIDSSKKSHGVAYLVNNGTWLQVIEEIAKCEVRCANCHRRRTSKQFGWFKSDTI